MKHVVATEAKETKFTPSLSQAPSLAAVAYLNMLPFFTDDGSVELFTTPRSLNCSIPPAQAYCSSLVAGLNAGKKPVSNQLGVFCSGSVQSVFIEPFVALETHAEFWHRLEHLWAHRQPDALAALSESEAHGKIILRTCGASEQSLWMVKVLSALAGFTVEVMIDTDAAVKVYAEKAPPEARLWIGDPALERRRRFPDAYRIDVSQVWNSHTGHRAWFAGWFAGSACGQADHSELTQILMNKTEAWKARSDFSRWCAAYKFLEARDSVLLNALSEKNQEQVSISQDDQHWELRDMLADYFSALDFTICPEEGERLLNFYSNINTALLSWERGAKQPPLTTPVSGAGVLSAADTHRNLNQ
jgi:predicted solute-binding protein